MQLTDVQLHEACNYFKIGATEPLNETLEKRLGIETQSLEVILSDLAVGQEKFAQII